ncbi:MAG TPA: SurA N-terminal domain-containing protein [Longimicrobiales bacterium]|nr:SurA N-terminal domain-containing protein [Longimicrobiales bacterium]
MVMRQMRENTKWIMLITALAFVALMVFEWGMDATGRSGAQVSGGEIGRVEGEPVTYEEYMLAYRNLYNQQQAAMGGQAISNAMNRQIEERAWEQVVTDKLIQRELKRRGIRVTDDEIRQAARSVPPAEFMSNPMFLTNGQFDMNKYTQFLASPAVDNQLLLQLEAYYRDIIPRSKLYFQVVAGTHLTDGDLWQMYRDANETASVRFLAFDPNLLVPDEAVTVTDQEIRRWYDEHQEDLQRSAQASVRFIAIPKAPTGADSAAVRTRVDSLRTAIVNGADFGAAARALSADSVSAVNGGELTIRRGQTVPEFDQAAFSRPIGQVGEPIRTMYGWHLLRVESRDGDSAVVRHILLPVERSLESEDALLARADSMDALAESRSLDEIARTFGLTPSEATFSEDFPVIALIGPVDEGADWAFDETPEVGELSPVLESENAFYMLELTGRSPAGTIPFEEARNAIRTRLMTEKKLERARQTANQALEQLNGGASMEQVAQSMNVALQEQGPFTRGDNVPGLGQVNAAIGTAFGLEPGERSGVVEANEMLYILESTGRTFANEEQFRAQLPLLRQQTLASLQNQRWNQFLAALEEDAKVVDARDQVLQPASAQQPMTGGLGF